MSYIVYEHWNMDFRYYGITCDTTKRWRWGYGYKGQPLGRLMEELRGNTPLGTYWDREVSHSILYKVESRKMAELLESMLIIRNKDKGFGKLVNGNNGAGIKYIKHLELESNEDMLAALTDEYNKEVKANEVVEWG